MVPFEGAPWPVPDFLSQEEEGKAASTDGQWSERAMVLTEAEGGLSVTSGN